MITKVLQSNDLRATMEYVYQESKSPEVVDTTCMDASREGALEDIREYIAQRPEIKKPVFHAVLSVSEDEYLDKNTWQQIAEEYTRKMGYGDVPYVAVRHQDTAHHHIHIVASRVGLDGELIRDSFEAYRSQEVARSIERTHDLTRVPSSWEVDRRRARPEELHRAMRLEEPAQRERMHQAITESLKRTQDVSRFVQELETHQIRVVPNVTQDDSKVQGISFERAGVRLAGSKINRQFSWNRLQSRLNYSHSRDLETLRRAPESRTPASSRDTSHTSPGVSTSPRPESLRAPQTHPSHAHTSPTDKPSPGTQAQASVPSVRPTQSPSPETPRTGIHESERIAAVLRRAPENQGWKAWADALKRDGVEAVPKVTQQDQTDVRGMYFVSGETMIPGSQVARDYSFKRLEQRLGSYEPRRDATSFERVMVPGHGLTSRPEFGSTPSSAHVSTHTPDVSRPTAEDAAKKLATHFETRGYAVVREPDSYKGYWRTQVKDELGQSYGVLAKTTRQDNAPSSSKEIALVALSPDTRLVEAHREQGSLRAHATISDVSMLQRHDEVVWKKEASTRALIRVAPSISKDVSTPSPVQNTPNTSPEQRLAQRFEQGGYRVQMNPQNYQGYWRTQVKDDAGHTYALLTKTPTSLPDATTNKEMALVRVDTSLQLVDAHHEQGKLVADRRLSGLDALRQDQAVVILKNARTHVLFRVPEHTPVPHTHVPTSEKSTPTSPVEAHAPVAPKPLPSLDSWRESMRQQGMEGRVLERGDAVAGKVMKENVSLKEGEFTAVHTGTKHVLLVPRHAELDKHAGKHALVTRRQDDSLHIKSLERGQDRGRSR